MKLIIDIPDQMYLNAKADTLFGGDILVKSIKNGIQHETVTEFADRCRECGAKYGKLLKQKSGKWIEHFDESGKWYECDQCHTDWGGSVNYCPNCGANMREVAG